MKKLGFGCMRLPLLDQNNQKSFDMPQLCSMVDAFLERGFTYFDTAYMYHDFESERVMKLLRGPSAAERAAKRIAHLPVGAMRRIKNLITK